MFLPLISSCRGGAILVAVSGALGVAAVSSPAATIGPAETIGTISSTSLKEVSGIVDSRANANVFWVHNDSGDSARFFAINDQGALQGTMTLQGASATDWEDAAIGPKPGGGDYLYFADIGDNGVSRLTIDVYRLTEPTSTGSATIPAADYSRARLKYPGGARNAEALFVDPITSDVFILSKTGTTQLYTVPSSAFGAAGTITLTSLGDVASAISTVTAADISPDGRYILVRSTSKGYLYERGAGQSIAQALRGTGKLLALGSESQGEAIAWSASGSGFYTTSEYNGASSAPIHSYWFAAPGLGDFDDDGDVDGQDEALWSLNFGDAAGADADQDGDSDGVDFLTWQQRFAGPRGSLQAPVPEPSGGWMACAVAAILAARSRAQGSKAYPPWSVSAV